MRGTSFDRLCKDANRSAQTLSVQIFSGRTLSLRSCTNRLSLLVITAVLVVATTACSTFRTRDGGASPDTGAAVSTSDKVAIKEAAAPTNDLNDNGSDLNAIPLEVNHMVLQWIEYFQGQGRPHMERYLSRLPRYAPIMKDILHKQGLPEDLIYIALIESGFSSAAHSSASAVGYWQFIKGTGHHYGLQIDSYVDERRDFVRSTQAAADYFKGLYNLFGAWYLAIASYNVGENRVKSVVMKYHTRDFWQLARENKLPEETVNYVPKFLAARLIAKEPEKYGFTDLEYMAPLEFATADFTNSVDLRKLAKELNVDYDDIRDLNPSYKRGVAFVKGNDKLTLRVPKGMEAAALAAATSAQAENRRVYVATEDWSYYRVRRGDNWSTIAHKFGTTQGALRQLNRMGKHSQLVAGRRIRVPSETVGGLARQEALRQGQALKRDERTTDASAKREEVTSPRRRPAGAKIQVLASRRSVSSRSVQSLKVQRVSASTLRTSKTFKPNFARHRENVAHIARVHVVRRGDTLIDIARRYNVTPKALARQNQIGARANVQAGSRLQIPE